MSPLIDCVFLLLIFFLVTSMLKKFERQIPLALADPTAAVALEPAGDALHIGIDQRGAVYREAGRDELGILQFAPTQTALPAFLVSLADGPLGVTRPVELVVEPGTPVQQVIDVLDVFELQGFDQVRARIRSRPFDSPTQGEEP